MTEEKEKTETTNIEFVEEEDADDCCEWDNCDTILEDKSDSKIYCDEHMKDWENWMQLLVFYVQSTLKTIDNTVSKQLNKDVPNYKTHIENELGKSKYMLKKFITEKNAEGMTDVDIAHEMDEL